MELAASILDTAGTVMIAYAALRVHHRFWREHKVDKKVFRSMRREQIIGITGLVFTLAGFLIDVVRLLMI